MLGKCWLSFCIFLSVCPLIPLCLEFGLLSVGQLTRHAACHLLNHLCFTSRCAFSCFIFSITSSVLCSFLQKQTSFPLGGDKGQEYQYYTVQISSSHLDYYLNSQLSQIHVIQHFSARILKNQDQSILVSHKKLVCWFTYVPENCQRLLNRNGGHH